MLFVILDGERQDRCVPKIMLIITGSVAQGQYLLLVLCQSEHEMLLCSEFDLLCSSLCFLCNTPEPSALGGCKRFDTGHLLSESLGLCLCCRLG